MIFNNEYKPPGFYLRLEFARSDRWLRTKEDKHRAGDVVWGNAFDRAKKLCVEVFRFVFLFADGNGIDAKLFR